MEQFHAPIFKYTCSFEDCDLQFKRKDQLDSHEYTHSKIKMFICTEPNCYKEYVNNAHLLRHKRICHLKNSTVKTILCKYEDCLAPFNCEAKLKQHYKKVHATSPHEYEFECDICGSKFRRKTQLKAHMFTHTGYYKYNCSKCDKGFLQMGHLKRHEKLHDGRRCDQCDAMFVNWSSLVAHKQKEHMNNETKCSICNKIFKTKSSLRHHKQTHFEMEDRTLYRCTFENCPKSFLQRKNMLAHYKTKHERMVFVCPEAECGQGLSTKQKLAEHMAKIHSIDEQEKEEKVKKLTIDITAKERAPRKDKGQQKVSTASKLFNIILPNEIEQAIIAGNGNRIYFNHDVGDDEGNITTYPILDMSVNKEPSFESRLKGVA